MQVDEDNKMDIDDHKVALHPIINDIDWNDNGLINLSFTFKPQSTHKILKYELYYCYMEKNENDDNDKWFGNYPWKNVRIPMTDCVNKNVQLKIAMNKALDNDGKNTNIELLLKLRCELKAKHVFLHSFYCDFSKIYYAKSISIPSILDKQTGIHSILNTIYPTLHNKNNNEIIIVRPNQNETRKREELASLYGQWIYESGINKVFTKLLIEKIKHYYKLKYDESLSSSNKSLSKYLLDIEQNINYETQNLFSCIDKYLNHENRQNIISVIINTAFDFENIAKMEELIKNTDDGINYLFGQLILDQDDAVKDLNRLLKYHNYFDQDKQNKLETYFCNSICNLFIIPSNIDSIMIDTTEEHKSNEVQVNIPIIKVYEKINGIISNKLNDKSKYHDSVKRGMHNYFNTNQCRNTFCSMIDKAIGTNANAKQELGQFVEIFAKIGDGVVSSRDNPHGALSMDALRNIKIRNCRVCAVRGLPSFTTEKLLIMNEWYGQFRGMTKISINRNNKHNISINNFDRNSVLAFITFDNDKSALDAINFSNAATFGDGRKLKAAFGIQYYCHNFLSNNKCELPYCRYKHEWVKDLKDVINSNEMDTFKAKAVKVMAEQFKDHVAKIGFGYVEKSKKIKKDDQKDGNQFIMTLIDLHDNLLQIVKNQFDADRIYHKALKEAFETFINKEYYTSALLARYTNSILQKGSTLTGSDLDNAMDHIVMLYGYIRDKDIFERDYQQYLGQRLLLDASINEQAERSMIGKLKNEAGYHWTSKLQDMFKDIARSKELMVDFHKKYSDFEYELNVSVCTTGAWPASSIQPVKKTPEILSGVERYTQFYLNRFSGRRLNFQMNKGKADVEVQFNAKTKKILIVSTYQMMILLLFNNKTTWTFKEMVDATAIPKEDLQVAVMSMVHETQPIMRKAPNSEDIEDSDKLQINPKYCDGGDSKIAIATLPLRKSAKKKLEEDRKWEKERELIMRRRRVQMYCAIYRIMKSRKTLMHRDLIKEVVKEVRGRFTPQEIHIKNIIDTCINNDDILRDKNNRELYHFNPGSNWSGV